MAVLAGDRPRASALSAYVDGWRRVLMAPSLIVGILLGTFVVQWPAAMAIGGVTNGRLSLTTLLPPLPGWNGDWLVNVARPLHQWTWIFAQDLFGFGGVAPILRFFVSWPSVSEIGAAAAAGIVLWAVVSGGALDRLARARAVGTAAFSAACGVYAIRFLRLGLWIGAADWFLFRWLAPFLLSLAPAPTTGEGMAARVWLSLACLVVLAAISLVGDYAGVRAVVEDRRSMTAAIGASLRFIRRRAGRALSLYVLNVATTFAVVATWDLIRPGGAAPAWALVVGGLVALLLQIVTRLSVMASEISLFQSNLAHVGYTASPMPEWPDSPSAEAIENLVRRNREASSDSTV